MATQYTAGLVSGQTLTAAIMNQIGAAWETFTPTWTSTGTQPALGNGTLTGYYWRVNKIVGVQVHLLTGSTTTYGTGRYRWALPVTASSSKPAYQIVGSGRYRDASATTTAISAACFYDTDTAYISMMVAGATDFAEATVPVTWASGDTIQLTFIYQAA